MNKVLIGIPFGKPQDMMSHQAWTSLMISVAVNPNYVIAIRYATTASLDANREFIAQASLDEKCDWCLMVDTDMSYPSNLLDVLISRDKDVIGVPFYSRGRDAETELKTITPVIYDCDRKTPAWYRWKMVKQTEPFRVDTVGGGILLIKTKVFKKLEQPWFPYSYYKKNKWEGILGDDMGFCLRCMEAGIEVWADPTFGDDIKHWHMYGYSKKDCTER